MNSYLQELTIRLAEGVSHFPDDLRLKHAQYLLSAQRNDGGFGGRQGDSDMYYTGFALRALSIIGELYGEPAERAASFVRSRLNQQEQVVDFFSLVYAASLLNVSAGIDVFSDAASDWRQRVFDLLMKLRRADGGFAKSFEGHASSTYHTFLVLLCLQMIEKELPEPRETIKFVKSREHDEGGFLEVKVGKRAGTNPTAAAIATLKILDGLNEDIIDGTVDFLCDMQSDEGGLCANTRIPIADGLSTFTGLLTLVDLDAHGEINLHAVRTFADSLQLPEGGFRAAAWDEAHDVEYTFYGISTTALLQTLSV
jgi:geranylgeranyl transferase type-2 subunit beta